VNSVVDAFGPASPQYNAPACPARRHAVRIAHTMIFCYFRVGRLVHYSGEDTCSGALEEKP